MRFASITDRLAGLGADKWAVHIEARRRARDGTDLIELTIGEPDSPPPPALIDTAIESLRARRTGYSGGLGETAMLEALAAHYTRRSGRTVTPAQIAYMPGTQTALYSAMTVLAEAGDEVLLGDPHYATYEGVIRATGAVPRPVPLRPEHGFHLRPEALAAAVTPRSRVLLLNSPHNPTGATLSAQEIDAILEVCRRHDLAIVSDEVYATMAYGAEFASPFDRPLGVERTVVVSSISKSHMLPGFRSGWCVGPEAFIARLQPVSETMLFGSQPFLQDALRVAMSRDFPECAAMVESFRTRAGLMTEHLANTPGLRCPLPEGGMFAFVDVRGTGLDGEAFAWRLLDEEGVSVMPGSSFGDEARGHVRVALSAEPDLLIEAARRMRALAGRLTREKAA